ncbi:MAG: hypothetical protein ACFFCZ_20270 [Promethearchaeota archaeon]
MSTQLKIRTQYAAGKPILFWRNRLDPFIIGNEVVAQSGKIAMVKNVTDNDVGKPMIVDFILARKSHLDTWEALVGGNPFNTTSLASYFSTGHTVMFRFKNPIVYKNMVLRDGSYDTNQTIFDSGHADYLKGFDLWQGTLNLIIVT